MEVYVGVYRFGAALIQVRHVEGDALDFVDREGAVVQQHVIVHRTTRALSVIDGVAIEYNTIIIIKNKKTRGVEHK
jgi:hypothetical protein